MRQLSLLSPPGGSHVHGHHGAGGLRKQLQPVEGGLVGGRDAALTAGLGVATRASARGVAFKTVVGLGTGRKDTWSSLFSGRFLKLSLPEDAGRPLPECECLRGGLGQDIEQWEDGERSGRAWMWK